MRPRWPGGGWRSSGTGTPLRQGTLVLVNVCQALLFLQVFLTAQAENRLPMGVAFGGLALLSWVLYGIYRAAQRSAYELESLVFLLISIGAAVTAYDPASLYKLLITVVMGMVLFLAMSGVLRDLHLSIQAWWPVALAAGALLAFNVVLGERIFGAKNWISIGPLSFPALRAGEDRLYPGRGRHPGSAVRQAEPGLYHSVFRLLRGMPGTDE